MWVTVAPAACTPPYETDNRSSWLEKGLIEIKTFFFFLTYQSYQRFPCHCGLDTSLSEGLGPPFLSSRMCLPPPFSCIARAGDGVSGKDPCPVLRHLTLSPGPGLLFQAVYPNLGNLSESPLKGS